MAPAATAPENLVRADVALLPQDVAPHARPNRPTHLNRIVASWNAAVNFLVPIGYEDESGFHFGGYPGSREAEYSGGHYEIDSVP